jgi:hypothetical protein
LTWICFSAAFALRVMLNIKSDKIIDSSIGSPFEMKEVL